MVALVSTAHRFRDDRPNRFAADELIRLQREQLEHDEYYHREIARLDMKGRVTHLTLHFAKYVGYLGELCDNRNADAEIQRILVDAFIISISAANTLNVRLSEKLDSELCKKVSLRELGIRLAHSHLMSDVPLSQLLLTKLSQPTGRMAKACEGLDHIESSNFRAELVAGSIEIFRLTLAAAAKLDLDIVELSKTRLDEVKERFIFHNC